MKVALVTIAYNLPESTHKLLGSARRTGYNLSIHLFLHSRHLETMAECTYQAARGDVFYYPYKKNRGLSRSWNEGMLNAYDNGADVVVIANDDIEFSPGDLDKLAEKAMANQDRYIISCAGFHIGENKKSPSHGYSCFAINPVALEKLGMFDENIFPIYMEDCDYAYRAGLAGLSEENCPDTMVYHGGSSAINIDKALGEQNIHTHSLNSIYYHAKWGGENEKERFKVPFNNQDIHPYYIPPERRHNPYGPQYDRTDQSVVIL